MKRGGRREAVEKMDSSFAMYGAPDSGSCLCGVGKQPGGGFRMLEGKQKNL